MTEAKHTAGPWSVGGFGPYSVAVIGQDREVVYELDCQVRVEHQRTDERLLAARRRSQEQYDAATANAILIAAAPELLDALRAAENFMAGFEGDELQDGIDQRLATVRAAIAKADGRSC